MQSVALDSVHQEQAAVIRDGSPVTTLRVCKDPLLWAGLEELLSNTRFAVWKGASHGPLALPRTSDMVPVLFIIDGDHYAEGTAELVADLKAHFPRGRVVVLADHFEFGAITSAWHAGVDGFLLSTIGRDALIRSLELVMLGEIVVPSAVVLSKMKDLLRCREFQLMDGVTNSKDLDAQIRGLTVREADVPAA